MTEPSVRIAVIVLNYRTPRLVLDCLASLLPQLDRARDRVIVVDNASGDESAAIFRREFPARGWDDVQILESPRNGGFAAGNNLGVSAVDAAAYFLLNSDTLVLEGAVPLLWSALMADSRLGLVGPAIESLDGIAQVSCFRFHTPWSEFVQAASTGPITRMLRRWDIPISPEAGSPEPEWISFAAVLIRREVIERVGLLDEGYFMYFEDVDYCRRAAGERFRISREPRARVIHLEGQSSGLTADAAGRRRRPRYYYASRSRYLRKAYGAAGLLAANALWTLGRAVAWSRETLGSKPSTAVERELLDLWRG